MPDRARTAADLRAQLRRVLEAIEAGDLAASAAMRYRLEGAIAALDAVLGDPSSLPPLDSN